MLGTAEPSICAQQALGCKLLTLGFFFAACATQADIAASRSSERCCIVRARSGAAARAGLRQATAKDARGKTGPDIQTRRIAPSEATGTAFV